MSPSPGTRLGHYDVTALIGEGGMGQVWQATDTQLNRQVALKILPDAFAADPDRLARFTREAQILASLNHPNIAAIHGIEEAEPSTGSGQGAVRALVLELVEGPTLADRIAQGAMPIEDALPIARQIAEALEAAHEAGVIHRDLKPANIKVREDGTVKVLDFGLAKALAGETGSDPSESPTVTAATQQGVILGTAAYMSPEQASGATVDKRADIWSFGVVLFEMLTGTRAFNGESVSHVLAAELKTEPDWTALPGAIPPVLGSFLRGCVQKSLGKRVQAIGDVRLAMEGAFETPVAALSSPSAVPKLQVWQRPIPALVVCLTLLVMGGVAVWRLAPSGPHQPVRFVITTPPDAPLVSSTVLPDVALSPDGTQIVYQSGPGGVSARQLYLRRLDQVTPMPIRGAEGAMSPFFSPDGESIGFRVIRGELLKRVSVLGGVAVTICPLGGAPRGMSWAADGTIVFATNESRGLLRVPEGGGDPEVLTTVDPERDETDHFWPEALSNGQGVLFTAWSGTDATSRIAVVSLETRDVTYLLTGGSHPRYSPTGHSVYAQGGTLWAIGFDADRLELTSTQAVAVVDNVQMKGSGAASFSLDIEGSLVYVAGRSTGGTQRILVWVDRQGNESPLDLPERTYAQPRLSPDGTRLAVTIMDENVDVWVSDLALGTLRRLTTDPAVDGPPLWTPEGDRVVFTSRREGSLGLYSRAWDGFGEAERLMILEDGEDLHPYSWSSDGNTLVFQYRTTAGGSNDIGILPMDGNGMWEALLETEANERSPAISPDGQWIVYESAGGINVARFPELSDGRLIGEGLLPKWLRTGEIAYPGFPRGTRVVEVELGPTFQVGSTEILQDEGGYVLAGDDVSPDGERRLYIKPASATDADEAIMFVQHWHEELERLVPVP